MINISKTSPKRPTISLTSFKAGSTIAPEFSDAVDNDGVGGQDSANSINSDDVRNGKELHC